MASYLLFRADTTISGTQYPSGAQAISGLCGFLLSPYSSHQAMLLGRSLRLPEINRLALGSSSKFRPSKRSQNIEARGKVYVEHNERVRAIEGNNAERYISSLLFCATLSATSLSGFSTSLSIYIFGEGQPY